MGKWNESIKISKLVGGRSENEEDIWTAPPKPD